MAPLSLSTLSFLSSSAGSTDATTTATRLSTDSAQLLAASDTCFRSSIETRLGSTTETIRTDPVEAILPHRAEATPVIQVDPTPPNILATTVPPEIPEEVRRILQGDRDFQDFTITKQTTGSTEPPVTATIEEFRQAVAAADDIKVENTENTHLARSMGMVLVRVAFTGSMTWIIDYCQRSQEKKNVSTLG
jgi:hypothetical protein